MQDNSNNDEIIKKATSFNLLSHFKNKRNLKNAPLIISYVVGITTPWSIPAGVKYMEVYLTGGGGGTGAGSTPGGDTIFASTANTPVTAVAKGGTNSIDKNFPEMKYPTWQSFGGDATLLSYTPTILPPTRSETSMPLIPGMGGRGTATTNDGGIGAKLSFQLVYNPSWVNSFTLTVGSSGKGGSGGSDGRPGSIIIAMYL